MLEINKIYQGDCLELMQDIPNKSIDMILCDLPYGTTACKWDTIIPFQLLWGEYKRIIRDKGVIVLMASQPFTSALVMSNIHMFKYCWVWNKMRGVGHLNAKKRPMMATEDIVIFGNNYIKYNPQMRDRLKPRQSKNRNTQEVYGKTIDYFKGKTLNKKYPINILEYSKSSYQDMLLHPTQKPIALFEYLIKTYSDEGDLVLDNCIGSGTTAVACIRTNRKFIGIELSKEYCGIANKRLEQQSLKQPL